MVDLKRVGANLRTLRDNMGLSQQLVATFLEVDQSLISKIEKGERPISADALEKLSSLYCCPTEQILNEMCNDIAVAFRTDGIREEDLSILSIVNRVALNQRSIDQLVKERLNA